MRACSGYNANGMSEQWTSFECFDCRYCLKNLIPGISDHDRYSFDASMEAFSC